MATILIYKNRAVIMVDMKCRVYWCGLCYDNVIRRMGKQRL